MYIIYRCVLSFYKLENRVLTKSSLRSCVYWTHFDLESDQKHPSSRLFSSPFADITVISRDIVSILKLEKMKCKSWSSLRDDKEKVNGPFHYSIH